MNMCIILTHLNDGNFLPILAILFLPFLQFSWKHCWIQSPTPFNSMSMLMAIIATHVHLLDSMICIVQWNFGFLPSFLQKFPVCGHSFPTTRNTMVNQTTKRTCNSFPMLVSKFSMLYMIKRNMIKIRFIHFSFTFITFMRR